MVLLRLASVEVSAGSAETLLWFQSSLGSARIQADLEFPREVLA